ncbi:DUF2470 domain-containing protein [Streptomyces sp. NPDC048644]|uniref:DUF2470 domain-containing protein n=1 Tax=Streptomyces sp. NPDC048644 TaxID=3365582 RepID=UPI0037152C0A
MRTLNSPPAQPTLAERIRTILASAQSMTLITDESRTEVSRLNEPGLTQHIHLHPLSDEPESGPGHAARRRVPATLEFTDVAPTAVRDRVRARVTVMGWLTSPPRPDAANGRCMQFARAVLDTMTAKASVGLADLMAATADPLATCEASMLTHLVDDHHDLVRLLIRLVEPRLVQGTQRAVPLALDRYGVTLRLEYAGGHHDVRIPFPTQLTDVDQFGLQIHALEAAARRRSHRSRLLSDS